MKDCCGNGRANIVPKHLFSFVALKKVDSLRTNHQITNVTTWLERGEILEFNYVHFYFGGARSKGFATLRNVSKLQFFDKIGHAKSVDFRLYSAI